MEMTTAKRILSSIAAILMIALAATARDINVRGIVTNSQGEPMQGVCIYNAENEQLLTSTNEEGKYLVIIDGDGKLVFSSAIKSCRTSSPSSAWKTPKSP